MTSDSPRRTLQVNARIGVGLKPGWQSGAVLLPSPPQCPKSPPNSYEEVGNLCVVLS